MAIKAGNLVHVGNGSVVIDRIQTGGPGQVNIKNELQYELGNYQSVGQTFDIPDLSFSLESRDVSCEIEALLLNASPSTQHSFSFTNSVPLFVKSAFKGGSDAASPFNVVKSVSVPYLTLESMSYRFGLQDAAQTATLKGDSIFYNQGSAYIESATASGSANQTVVTANAAYAQTIGGVQRRVQCVMIGSTRLTLGIDYTESYGSITAGAAITTVTILAAWAGSPTIRIMYASPVVESLPQTVHALVTGNASTVGTTYVSGTSLVLAGGGGLLFSVGDGIIVDPTGTKEVAFITAIATDTLTLNAALPSGHASGQVVQQFSPTVKPAAIRGRDIRFYLGTYSAASPNTNRIPSVQSVNMDWRVQLQQNEEFGSYNYVSQDYDVPTVSGSVTIQPRDVDELLTRVKQIAGISSAYDSVAATSQGVVPVTAVLTDPATGAVLKVLRCPDARFTVPGFQGRVQQKLPVTFNFTSDSGAMTVGDA